MSKHSLKALCLGLCALLGSASAAARTISVKEARDIAGSFFNAETHPHLASAQKFTPVQTAKEADGTPSYYVFKPTQGKGFIIIAAQDNVRPVIGFSYSSDYPAATLPSNAAAVMKGIGSAIKNAPASAATARIKAPARVAANGTKELNTAQWSQEAPFNNQIPNRRLTGCVGLAMSIIVKHHHADGASSGFGQLTDPYGTVDFAGTTYQWGKMLTSNYRAGSTAEQQEAVATLVGHAARSIRTDFGQSTSSAFEVLVPQALINHFGFDAGVSFRKRSETSREEWEQILVDEISAGRPVIYSGQDLASGHAWVCDGYQVRPDGVYFHMNWGWGGAANAFYRSDMLNPTVSRSHNYNDQTTIVYNMKLRSSDLRYSDIHLTADLRQPGMTVDVTDIPVAQEFTLRAGCFKNISDAPFSGKIAVALVDADGSRKAIVSPERSLALQGLQAFSDYCIDFRCSVPATVAIADGDALRLITKAAGSDEWLPVAADLGVTGEIPAKGYVVPYFTVSLPAALEGAAITDADTRVVKGRDYTFTVTPAAADKCVTVKANGFILAGNGNAYRIPHVSEDQTIAVVVQNAADVVSRRYIYVTPGTLASKFDELTSASVKDLTLFGSIDARDFFYIRDYLKLERLDLSGCNVVSQGSNPANAIPDRAFVKCRSLKRFVFPSGVNYVKNNAFAETGLTEIEIPASVSKYDYNVFYYCYSLRKVTVRNPNPAFVNWCVFSGVPADRTLIVPVGSKARYEAKENWTVAGKTVVMEQNASTPDSFEVIVQDAPGVCITPITEGNVVAKNDVYKFTAVTDASAGDATVEFYANRTRLVPDAQGVYTALVNARTLIYTNFKMPEPMGSISTWTLTDGTGGTGLVTEAVNVMPGKQFSVLANAVNIPQINANNLYAMALTDGHGKLKEIISNITGNQPYNYGLKQLSFVCTVKEASIREGNSIVLVNSADGKMWNRVRAAKPGLCDSIRAVGNPVTYHAVNFPAAANGIRVEGQVSQVVHGMPLNFKVAPAAADQVVTVAINGEVKASRTNLAAIAIPCVTTDIDVAIQVADATEQDMNWITYEVSPGQLASKLSGGCPERLKLIGAINYDEFSVIAGYYTKLQALDISLLTIKGNLEKADMLPSNAFCASSTAYAALTYIALPTSLRTIGVSAFARCNALTAVTIPENTDYISNMAFYDCTSLSTVTVLSSTPPRLGNSAFRQPWNITLKVPGEAYDAYFNAPTWGDMTIDGAVFFNIKYDQNRAFQVGTRTLFKIPFSLNTVDYAVGLPNSRAANMRNITYRPGTAFKVYLDDVDIIPTLDGSFSDMFSKKTIFKSGQYKVAFNGRQTNPNALDYSRNKEVRVEFYYDIPLPSQLAFAADPAENRWNAPMIYFGGLNESDTRTLYREGRDYKLRLTSEAPEGMTYRIYCTTNVCTKPGYYDLAKRRLIDPVYEPLTAELLPDDNGFYTLANLQGDVTGFNIKAVPAEAATVTPEVIRDAPKEDVAHITEISVSGNLDDATAQALREKFENLEVLDLSQVTSTAIPDNAFAGMSHLNTVTIPDGIQSIGAGAFSGCTQLSELTLNSVDEIGPAAFSGCTQLTSVTLNCRLSAPTAAMHRAPRAAGITPQSFDGANPNCIILVADQAIAASLNAAKNVIYTNEQPRRALTDLHLTAGHPLNIPVDFTLGTHRAYCTAPLTAAPRQSRGNWSGLTLPFAPQSYTVDGAPATNLEIYSYATPSAESFSHTDAIAANVPYLMRVNTATADIATVCFTAADSDITATPAPEAIVNTGLNATLHGTYTGIDNTDGDYLIDQSGETLRLIDPNLTPATAPFGVYARSRQGLEAPEEIAIDESSQTGITDVEAITTAGLRLSRTGTLLNIDAPAATHLNIYDLRGRAVLSLTIPAGRTTYALPAGLYIVNGKKIMM